MSNFLVSVGAVPTKMKHEEKVKLESIHDVHCPECGGKINRVWLHDYSALTSQAIFIAECWSGDLNKPSNYHIFKIRCPVNSEVDLTEEE